MADAALIFDIIGRDRLGPALAKAKAEAMAASEGARDGMSRLDAQIRETERSADALTKKFVETGDVDILKDLRKENKTLEGLRKVRAELQGMTHDSRPNRGFLDFALDEFVTDGFRKAKDAAAKGMSSLADSISGNPILSTAIIGAIVVMAPFIIGTLAQAVGAGLALGFAGGVMALGIARALRDDRIQIAWRSLFDRMGDDLDDMSGRFVQPLVRGADVVGEAWDRLTPHLDSAMEALAPVVDGLFDGLAGFMDELGPGIDAISNIGADLLADFGDFLPDLGNALTGLFQTINENAPTVRAFFNDFLDLVVGVVDAMGWLVDKGAAWYQFFGGLGEILGGNFSEGAQRMVDSTTESDNTLNRFHNTSIKTKDVLGLLTGEFKANADGQIAAAVATGRFASQAVDAQNIAGVYLNTLMTLDQADLSFHSSLTAVSEGLTRSSHELDINTAAGQQHRSTVLAAVSANIQQYQAMIQSGLGADAATSSYNANTRALEHQLQQAGLTKEQIDGLIGKYRNVPANVDTDIAINGLTAAIGNLDHTLRLVNGLHDKSITITTFFTQVGRPAAVGDSGEIVVGPASIRAARAGGGPVSTGQPYLVGEDGPEIIYPTGNGQVIPHRESMALLGGSSASRGRSAGGGGGPVTVNVYAMAGGPQVGAQVVEAISAYEKANGSGWRS